MLTITGAPTARIVSAPAWGRQHRGHTPGGPADRFAATVAGHLLGDAPGTPMIEWSLSGLQAQVTSDAVIVLTGAVGPISCAGQSLPAHTVLHLRAGSTLTVAPAEHGLRGYLAIAGGIAGTVDHATFTPGCGGQHLGRRRGPWGTLAHWAPHRGILRALPGPEYEPAVGVACDDAWRVTPQSDASGLRLQGSPLQLPSFDIQSAPVADGTVQASASGPIILLRDRQTIGGYPRILQVIDSDIDLAAQLRPHAAIRFELVDQETALHIWQQRCRCLADLAAT